MDPIDVSLQASGTVVALAVLIHQVRAERKANRRDKKTKKRDEKVAAALAEQKAIAEETRLAANRLKDALATARAEGARTERDKE